MRNATSIGIVAASAAVALFATSARAQDYFPSQVPRGTTTVGIRDFARLPDATPGNPSRGNLMFRDPLGRLVVSDQRGPVYTVADNGAGVTQYLNVASYASTGLIVESGERGLQSIAFHPDFNVAGTAGFGKFYTLLSSRNTSPTPDFGQNTQTAHHEVLLEWRTNTPGSATFAPADAAQPFREVVRFNEPFGNHTGGQISFNTTAAAPGSADRTNLYIGLGDGGSGNDPLNNGQNAGTPLGAILRIDPTGSNSANGKYGLVAGNVLASDGNAGTLAETYAFGFRNPQRFGWDADTGRMFVADIGQNAVEELDLVVNGGNYGWSQREGSFTLKGPKTPTMIDPIAEYDHTNVAAGLGGLTGNRAITMGEVVRGSGIAGLDGQLLFGDFPSGLIFTLDADNDPFDGGQDGIRQLNLVDKNFNSVRLIDLINAQRAADGRGAVDRTDLRFSLGTGGEIYVLNKQDNVIRQLVAIPEPATLIAVVGGAGALMLRRRPR